MPRSVSFDNFIIFTTYLAQKLRLIKKKQNLDKKVIKVDREICSGTIHCCKMKTAATLFLVLASASGLDVLRKTRGDYKGCDVPCTSSHCSDPKMCEENPMCLWMGGASAPVGAGPVSRAEEGR